jgi:hypothetical protein
MLTVTNHIIQNAFILNHKRAQEKSQARNTSFQNNNEYFYAFWNTMEQLRCQQHKLNSESYKKNLVNFV